MQWLAIADCRNRHVHVVVMEAQPVQLEQFQYLRSKTNAREN